MLANRGRQFLALKSYSLSLPSSLRQIASKANNGQCGSKKGKGEEPRTAGGKLKLDMPVHYLRRSLYGPIKLNLSPRVIKISL